MSLFKKFFVLSIVLVLSIGLFGCSSDAENTYEEVIERGSISFAMSGGYPPFNYYDDNNQLVGFDVEIAAEIAKRLGVESKPVTTAWDGILVGLQTGDYDGILGSMAITEERQQRADFSDPYYYSGAQLVVKAGSGISSFEDMEGLEIGVVTGTTFADVVEELGATPVFYDGDDMTLRELDNGNIDGVITDFLVGLMAIEEFNYDFEFVGEWLYTERLAVAFRQGDDELREAVNTALAAMIADGTYEEISYRYFGEDISQPR
ncbi:transporter substrate-binding domain-containing protein [Alkalicella caledoniensis]|uniref:Transporter substrate-binding domain-containing protein n=1 Tax=Alkalicella caledoniensis TaxID=2731377 RepID=A0A7G9W815_ALKCA|nr:ABC transporter substrate-binding protein [Alkalicella caledoniensis]QNO14827.1 transporter substrate-binding domain-containing protein [Alkalicella caledoniensis]